MAPSWSSLSPSNQCYQLVGRLPKEAGHAVNCLTINEQGNLLASGSDYGLKMWDLKCLVKVPSLVRQHAFHNPVSAAMWITQKDDTSQTLCFGTRLGYLIFWHQSTKSNSMQFKELVVKRVVTGIQLSTMAPKGIAFMYGQKGVYVWGMYDGQMAPVDGCNGSRLAFKQMAKCDNNCNSRRHCNGLQAKSKNPTGSIRWRRMDRAGRKNVPQPVSRVEGVKGKRRHNGSVVFSSEAKERKESCD
ncbi:hypothetical protein SCLCIDRAFT_8537 [Scleroderma citrinum Foug A]|uniref:Uncharacterized protein n=1 Tax=Scleroderma citrinum Foug A TaxID=1036808 RepID=A0A0C3E888_9AGAM|nr:hypothetical protein SCLCIDRAFT_8537 [Scleroderma citrinum Foug A]